MADDLIRTIPDEGEEDNMVFKQEESSDEENGEEMNGNADFTKNFQFDGDSDEGSTERMAVDDEPTGKVPRSQRNSRLNKLEERIRRKRADIVKREQVRLNVKRITKEADKENEESSDEEEDITEEEDVVRSVKNTLEGEEKKVPSKEKFFSDETKTDEPLAHNFNQLRLSRPLLRAVNEMGFTTPTPIQARCIPLALAGKDICAAAKTGSGKTAAYLLPIMERLLYKNTSNNLIRVVIVTPTRELASQVYSIALKLAKYTQITCALIVGGLPLQSQAVDLKRRPDIVICTPGRMIDHVHNTLSVDLDDVEVVILDEADRLLDLGFTEELHELLKLCPVKRQTLLFSATMTDSVSDLISLSLHRPAKVFVDPVNQVVDKLIQEFVRVRQEDQREPMLLSLLTRHFPTETIVFCEKKAEAHRLHVILGLMGLRSSELHGNLTQSQRLQALDRFAKKEVDIMLATDVAARGLDIKGVKTVINLHMPKDEATYIHRVGRTARAGHAGRAVTFVEEERRMMMKDLVRRAVAANQQIKTRVISKSSIEKFQKKLEELKSDIDEVFLEERTEKEMETATMELTRADNLLKHDKEIHARRKRTWFQTEREKKAARAKEYAAKKAKKD